MTSVGLGTGADLFVIGRNNEGLRVGPRVDVSFGTESFGEDTTYGRLGASGELGYNFIARNGWRRSPRWARAEGSCGIPRTRTSRASPAESSARS